MDRYFRIGDETKEQLDEPIDSNLMLYQDEYESSDGEEYVVESSSRKYKVLKDNKLTDVSDETLTGRVKVTAVNDK